MSSAFPLMWVLAVALLLGHFPAAAALPNQELLCPEEAPELDPYRYVRVLSIQLRGVVPSVEEYDLVKAEGEVPESLIDAWLESDGFVDEVVRHHRSLLWNNVTNVTLNAAPFSFRREGVSLLYWRTQTAILYRGSTTPCLNEPAEYHPNGTLKTTTVGDAEIEGYLWVTPYWNSETSIKVCAFDAQEAMYGLTGVFCGSRSGRLDPTCGCGESLRYCRYGNTQREVTEAFGVDVDRRVAANLQHNESYVELLTGQRAFVNGPMVHFYKHQIETFANVRFDPLALNVADLPDLQWEDDDTWVEIKQPAFHAGVLSSPAFLLRFQTNRARANRFYDAFLCQPFNAPSSGLPVSEETWPSPDLQLRTGCKYCHALLEPASAHWGRWGEGSTVYLDPMLFPPERPDCMMCAFSGLQCDEDCNRFYLTNALSAEEDAYLGMLKAHVFRRLDHVAHIDGGPKLLVNRTILDGRLPQCVATKTAQWLLGRQLDLEDKDWVRILTDEFIASGFSFRALVKAVVQSPVYRRVR